MALSPESRQSDFFNSIKKYFLDKVETGLSISVFFDWIADIPKNSSGIDLTKWLIVEVGAGEPGPVSVCAINLHLFTISDFENYEMNLFADKVLGILINEDSTNGLYTIDYFNTSAVPWVKVGGIIPFIKKIFEPVEAKNNAKIKTINLLCKWGGK